MNSMDLMIAKSITQDERQLPLFCYVAAAYRAGYLFVERSLKPHPQELFEEGEVSIEKILEGFDYLAPSDRYVYEQGKLYLPVAYKLLQSIQHHHKRLATAVQTIKPSLAKAKELLALEKLNAEQKTAILHALEQPISAIWGGPGTGKTYTAGLFLKTFLASISLAERKAIRIVACAPTGKAATTLAASIQRSCSELHIPAKTVHALLELRTFEQKNAKSTLPFDLVLVDESSMLDSRLCERLLSGMPDSSRLLFLGDPDQLPPVEPGAPFSRFITAAGGLKTSLRAEFREILELAALVKQGLADEAVAFLKQAPKDSCIKLLPFDETKLLDHGTAKLLTPMRSGPFGTNAINELHYLRHVKRLGIDAPVPIIISKNDYSLELTNGQVGTLTRSHAHFETLDGTRKIPRVLLGPYEFAFCLSVHKSQGSEFDEVVILLPPGSERFGRKMLYTAITRAKKKVTLLATEDVLRATISSSPSERE